MTAYSYLHNCDELNSTISQQTTDNEICSDRVFWDGQSCGGNLWYRCTGKFPGQCWDGFVEKKCVDKSHEILPPKQGLSCNSGEIKCVARKGIWSGLEVCLDKNYECDGIIQCNGEEDEASCGRDANVSDSKTCDVDAKRENGHKCNKFYKQPSGGQCDEMLKCIARDGRFKGFEVCVPSEFICDNSLQCQGGEDEHDCDEQYLEKKIFRMEEDVICTSRNLTLTINGTTTGHFFPYRGGFS